MSWWFEKTADSVDAAVTAVMTDKNIPLVAALFTAEVIKGCGKTPQWPATLYVKSAGHIGDPASDNKFSSSADTCQIEARWVSRVVPPEPAKQLSDAVPAVNPERAIPAGDTPEPETTAAA